MIHNDTDSDTDTNISININNLYYIEFIDDFVGEKMEILQNCLTLSYFYHYICLYYFCLVSLKLVELVSIWIIFSSDTENNKNLKKNRPTDSVSYKCCYGQWCRFIREDVWKFPSIRFLCISVKVWKQ